MGYDLTIQGLIRKRAELAGEAEDLHCKLASVMGQLNAIDTSIRVFKPGIELEDLPAKVPPAPLTGFRGEIQRFLLDRLREADGPLTTFTLAEAIMERRGLDKDDKIVHRLIARRTGYALQKLYKKGSVRKRQTASRQMEWWV